MQNKLPKDNLMWKEFSRRFLILCYALRSSEYRNSETSSYSKLSDKIQELYPGIKNFSKTTLSRKIKGDKLSFTEEEQNIIIQAIKALKIIPMDEYQKALTNAYKYYKKQNKTENAFEEAFNYICNFKRK